jgi:phosphocarrier protein FPr
MVEVPAAALKIESFLPHLDFVSIGTNDLTQYTVAAERGNAGLASLSDSLDPAVLQLVDHVCQTSRGRVDVAVCGEVAADEVAVPLLVGLGVRELSVSPHAVPRVKARVRDLDREQCEVVAKQALRLESAAEVRDFVAETLGTR